MGQIRNDGNTINTQKAHNEDQRLKQSHRISRSSWFYTFLLQKLVKKSYACILNLYIYYAFSGNVPRTFLPAQPS